MAAIAFTPPTDQELSMWSNT